MKNIFAGKTFWLTLAILLVVAGGILAVSLLGSGGRGEAENTLPAEELTTVQTAETTAAPTTAAEEKTTTAPPPVEPVEPEPDLSEHLTVVNVRAESDSGYGIAPDSEFILSGLEKLEKLTAITLERHLSVEPDYGFTLLKNAKGEFVLKLDEALPENQLLRIKLLDDNGNPVKAWAFQTESALRVTRAFPVNNVWVDLNQGIEVSFSARNIELDAFKEHFDIYPAVKGSFSRNGNSFIFYPDEPMRESTAYTVTVKAGLASASGQELAEDYVFTFSTRSNSAQEIRRFHVYSGSSESFLPDDTQLIPLWAYGYQNSIFHLRVFSFADADSYLDYLYDKSLPNSSWDNVPRYDTSELSEPVAEYDLPLSMAENGLDGYLLLPENLPEGRYLVEISSPYVDVNGRSGEELCYAYRFMQVSPLSLGMSALGGEMLFWVNDSSDGKAARGAQITLKDKASSVYVKADADGVAVTSFPLSASEYWGDNPVRMSVEYDGHIYADIVNPFFLDDMLEYDYYTYLYTDRAVYHNTDTVNLFGMVAPRQKKTLPAELFAVLYADNAEMQRQELALSAGGSFVTSFAFKDYSDSANYFIKLQDGNGAVYKQLYLAIREYANPVYLVESSPDRIVYEFGEEDELNGTLNVKVSFFDGTPAAGMALDLNMYTYYSAVAYDREVVLDANGEAQIPFTLYARPEETMDDGSYYVSYNLTNGNSNNEESIWHHNGFQVFFRNILVNESVSEDKNSLTVKLNRIDLSGIENERDLWAEENYTGAPADGEVYLELYRRYTVRTQVGTYYDYIQKQSIPRYQYDSYEEYLGDFNVESANGEAVFTDLLRYCTDEDSYYYVRGSVNDVYGRPVNVSCGWRLGAYYGYYPEGRLYFSFRDASLPADAQEYSSSFVDGQAIPLMLLGNDEPLDSGRFLAAQASDSWHNPSVQPAGAVYTAAFSEDMLPQYETAGFYFDGKHIYPITSYYCYYDSQQRKLEVEISADADSYAPGSEIKLDVTVKDADGRPAADSEVLISVVDEAAFAVQEQDADILRGIYSRHSDLYLYYYASYKQHNPIDGESDASEGGGEGGAEYIRDDFVDTAGFAVVKTDRDGHASLSVTMPDNLTTWRVTAQAFNKAMHAGSATAQTVVTMPFFVKPVFTSTCIEGDKASVSLRCYGTQTDYDADVEYRVTLAERVGYDALDLLLEQDITAKAGEYAYVDLGELHKGTYQLYVRAVSGSYSDSVSYDFSCVSSAVQVQLAENFSLADGVSIDASAYPVALRFTNGGYKQYNRLLTYLLRNAGYERAEQQIVRDYVLDIIDPDGQALRSGSSNWVQPYGRGVVLFNKFNSDLDYNAETSALAAIAVPEKLNTEGLAAYLYQVVNAFDSPSEDVAAAYMGLAALGEPVLLDIRYLLNGDWLEYDEALYLLAGLIFLNDEENAQPLYESFITSRIERYDDPIRGELACITGEDEEGYYTQFRTAMALLCATANGDYELAAPLAAYLQSITPDRYLYLLQLLYYAKHMQPEESVPASFSYKLNGETLRIELGQWDDFRLYLNQEQLAAADLKVISGEVNCTAFYEGSPDYLNDGNKELISIDKKITPVKGDGGPGTVYLVTLNVRFDKTAPYGSYYIEDSIPSGCRFVRIDDRAYNENWYLNEQSLQHISFYYPNIDNNADISIYGSGNTEMTAVRYYIRSLLPGEYVVDSAVISNRSTGIWGKSVKGMLNIE